VKLKKLTTRFWTLTALSFLASALLVLPSCKKKEEQPAQQPAAVNAYSSESVYSEVKEQVKKNPNDVDARYHLADLYDRNGLYKEAIEEYKKVAALKPDMGYVYVRMGTAYNQMNQPADAVEAFKEAIKHMPKNPVAYNNLGIAYGKLGKYDEEIAMMKKAIQIRPTYTTAHFNLGMTYLKLRDKKSAMKQQAELMKFDEGAAETLLKQIEKAP
jgi:tetratricopeptide (TPR) repeat protein